MKNITFSFAVIVSLLAVSCKKETEVKPQGPVTPKEIGVEYRIVSETSNVNVTYLFPNSKGELISTHEEVKRSPYSVYLKTTSGHFLSVEASNVIPASKDVTVQIIVDGVLFKESTSHSPSQPAVASGNY